MPTWFLVVFLYNVPLKDPDKDYVDKVAIPMSGKIEQHCSLDKAKILRYNMPIEGTDNHKVFTVCVPRNEWRGEK
jgi:hypothetical protein